MNAKWITIQSDDFRKCVMFRSHGVLFLAIVLSSLLLLLNGCGGSPTETLKMKFVPIPAGSFTMGTISSETPNCGRPLHQVTLTKAFEMQTTEVTQAQWKAVTGKTMAEQRDLATDKSFGLKGEGADYPIYYVNWDDCQSFIRKLNELDPGKGYRLPTEAEWEYACRAGSPEDRYIDLDAVAWYEKNSGGTTHPVGQKQPNSWGLYDMLGNVCEWCNDWYGNYPAESVTDPAGPSSGSFRVYRPGCWNSPARLAHSTDRLYLDPSFRFDFLGFRLVRDAAR